MRVAGRHGGVVAVVTLPVGVHLIDLVVDDGMADDTDSITIEVITPSQALGTLLQDVIDSGAGNGQSLPASLWAALDSIDRGNPISAINQLQAFQHKVLVQVAPEDLDLAAGFIQRAQDVIDTLAEGRIGSKNLRALANQDTDRVSVGFSGSAGSTYLVEASDDLVNWRKIGVARHRGDGTFDFDDPDTARIPHRFYRIVQP